MDYYDDEKLNKVEIENKTNNFNYNYSDKECLVWLCNHTLIM